MRGWPLLEMEGSGRCGRSAGRGHFHRPIALLGHVRRFLRFRSSSELIRLRVYVTPNVTLAYGGMGRTSPSRTSPVVQRHPHLCSHRTNVTLTSFATRQCPPRTSPSRLRGTVIGSIATVDPATTKFRGEGIGATPRMLGRLRLVDPAGDGHTRVKRPHYRGGTPSSRDRSAVASPAILAGFGGPLASRTRRQSTGGHVSSARA